MADIRLPDHILQIILARLPTKPLLRFKQVSKHWNSLIQDPHFMKLRSRPIILLPTSPLLGIDNNSIVKLRSPFKCLRGKEVTFVGAFKGVVLMVVKDYENTYAVLYNPFTGVFRRLPDPPSSRVSSYDHHAFGFGHGANRDDLKIIMFSSSAHDMTCDVFGLKESLWSRSRKFYERVKFEDDVGTFVNGFLYWIGSNNMKENLIIALNVEDMVLSEMQLPYKFVRYYYFLGTLHGRLCTTTKSDKGTGFDVWVMNEHEVGKSWSKNLTFVLEDNFYVNKFRPISILDDRRILMKKDSHELMIFDKSKDSYYGTIKIDVMLEGCLLLYTESLVSPFDMC